MSDHPPEPDDLRALGARLDDMRRREGAQNQTASPSALGIAYRFMTELVVALLVGGAIGWGLDRVFGSRPILMIVFVVLGAAAGIRNVVLAAKDVNKASGAQTPPAVENDEER
ncbi:MAG: AtpZ/AtpI family protein [Alphaproteobacteria bacterium]|nr:AtpZ/AtpI family protein [Alphaproteobacteria bacterium]